MHFLPISHYYYAHDICADYISEGHSLGRDVTTH